MQYVVSTRAKVGNPPWNPKSI